MYDIDMIRRRRRRLIVDPVPFWKGFSGVKIRSIFRPSRSNLMEFMYEYVSKVLPGRFLRKKNGIINLGICFLSATVLINLSTEIITLDLLKGTLRN